MKWQKIPFLKFFMTKMLFVIFSQEEEFLRLARYLEFLIKLLGPYNFIKFYLLLLLLLVLLLVYSVGSIRQDVLSRGTTCPWLFLCSVFFYLTFHLTNEWRLGNYAKQRFVCVLCINFLWFCTCYYLVN